MTEAIDPQGKTSSALPEQRVGLFLVLLVVFWLLIDLVVVLYFKLDDIAVPVRHETMEGVTVWGLVFGQLAIVAGWTVLACGGVLRRITFATFAFFTLYGLTQLGENTHSLFTVSSIYFLLTMAGLCVVRIAGFSLQIREACPQASTWQFSILQIMGLTTLVAIVLKLVSMVTATSIDTGPLEFTLLELTIASLAWIVWPAMMRLPLALGLPVALAVAPLLGWIAGTIEGSPLPEWLIFLTLQAAVQSLSLIVLRIAGYELVRR